jgi:DNA-binding MarR family transcriptional regulator
MNDQAHKGPSIPQLEDLARFRFELRSFLSFSEAASEACGIATQQYQLLQVIGAAPADKLVSISYLAERMILRHNSTVELVDRAERAGLVERRNDATDLRRSVVFLTAHGWKMLETLVPLHLDELKQHGDEIIATLRALQHSQPEDLPEG